MTGTTKGDARTDFMAAAIGQLDTAMSQAASASERMMTLHNGNLAFATDLTKLGLAFGEQAARRMQALGRAHIEQAGTAFRAVTTAPTPAEIIAVQLDFVRTVSNGFAAEMTQASEAAMQHSGAVLEAMARHLGAMAEEAKSGGGA